MGIPYANIYFHLYALQCKEEDKNTTVFSIILYLCCQWIILATLLIGIIELYNFFDTSIFIIIELSKVGFRTHHGPVHVVAKEERTEEL